MGNELTITEIHAALLGLVGLIAGLGFRSGFADVVMGGTVVLFGVAFGLRKLDSKAANTLRREPWYFTTVYVVSSVVGWLLPPVVLGG